MTDQDHGPYVVGTIKLPWHRKLGCRLGYLGMWLHVPCAARLYFRCLLGRGVNFEVVDVEWL